MRRFEANLDGMVGPTHNYAGLGMGNKASASNRGLTSNPRAAAIQGLEKMWLMHGLGLRQMVMPPLHRPNMEFLFRLGFRGRVAQILEKANRADAALLAMAYSASSMWTANAATVCPAADSQDGRVHFTPANLSSQIHRSQECSGTTALLRKLFPAGNYFTHHDPLPNALGLGDEGAANHTRFSTSELKQGAYLFVHGPSDTGDGILRYPARQSKGASQAVARMQGLSEDATVFAQQSTEALNAGVFHNDVISVGHEDFFFCHERAFTSTQKTLEALRKAFMKRGGKALRVFLVNEKDLSLKDTVATYLFNSQIVTLSDGRLLMLAAEECKSHQGVRKILLQLVEKSLLKKVVFANLRQSMRNGGGPACLRLRVELSEAAWKAVHPGVKLEKTLYQKLRQCVIQNYRDRLSPHDFLDPELIRESISVTDKVYSLLGLT